MHQNRRSLLKSAVGLGVLAAVPPVIAQVPAGDLHLRPIPASGERIPAIGMGTWLTFDIGGAGNEDVQRDRRRAVLQAFFDRGGRLIDSSPMYGSAESVIGTLLRPGSNAIRGRDRLFAATKVWTIGEAAGRGQMETSIALWRGEQNARAAGPFDLIQIHNMLDWRTHLQTLTAWKAAGRIRYLGITTSHGNRHEALEAALKRERFDFVQFTYNLADRAAESRLLPLAQDRGAAVIVNRPFDGGRLFDRAAQRPLPAWAAEAGMGSWAEFFLKFVISHPAVTCAIPATSRPEHMAENMAALRGPMPDAALRARMAEYWDGG